MNAIVVIVGGGTYDGCYLDEFGNAAFERAEAARFYDWRDAAEFAERHSNKAREFEPHVRLIPTELW